MNEIMMDHTSVRGVRSVAGFPQRKATGIVILILEEVHGGADVGEIEGLMVDEEVK